jgi:ABC-type transport system involved in multi-copper enzyme maturation permease subunit
MAARMGLAGWTAMTAGMARLRRRVGAARLRFEPNPVLVKELRSQFRGPRAFVVLTVFLAILALFAFREWSQVVERMAAASRYGGRYGGGYGSDLGTSIFNVVAWVEVLTVALIAPALTITAVSGERERQTWELLLATPLSAWSILLGKVAVALAYVALLVLAALPVMGLSFLFGGVAPGDLAVVQSSVFLTGMLFVSVGVFWSTMLRRTVPATFATYLSIVAMLVGIIAVMYAVAIPVFRGDGVSGAWREPFVERLVSWVLGAWPVLVVVEHTGGSDWLHSAPWTGISTTFQILASGLLIGIAGSVIRRPDRRTVLVLLLLLCLVGVWCGWVEATVPIKDILPGSHGQI